MYQPDRFTRASRVGRHAIPKATRFEIFSRDNNTCQYCGEVFSIELLEVDHLIPVSKGGLDEVSNYATACRYCNRKKAAKPLAEFAAASRIAIEDLPVHGDPVIDNLDIPIQIRTVRKRIFDRLRQGDFVAIGKSAQKRTEHEYRRALWSTKDGIQLTTELPHLPGHARASIVEVRAIANSEVEELFLRELVKSATTRNLLDSMLTKKFGLWPTVKRIRRESKDTALTKRLEQALRRFETELLSRGLPYPADAPRPERAKERDA